MKNHVAPFTCLILTALLTFGPVSGPLLSQHSTSGLGSHLSEIYWLIWSSQGLEITEGLEETFDLPDGSTLTATFSNVTDLASDYPRFWTRKSFSGNKLDDYYDGLDPMMIQVQSPDVFSFRISLSRTGGSFSVPLHVVFADAEDNKLNEYVQATTDGDDWQVVELMTTASGVTIKPLNWEHMRFTDSDKSIKQFSLYSGSYFPGAIYLSQNASTLDFELTSGGGFSGCAIGIWMPFDYGDHSSYGAAAHFLPQNLSGGFNPNPGDTDTLTFQDYNNAATAFSVAENGLYIGADVDPDSNATQGNQTASADGSDDDGATFSAYDGGGSYDIDVEVTHTTGGNAYLAAYLDIDQNGDFMGPNEAASVVTVNGSGTYQVSFSGLPHHIFTALNCRIRLSSQLTEVTSPVGFASDGEVEDYQVSETIFPVDLLDFQAIAEEGRVRLHWTTGSELQSKSFEVLKSTNEVDWVALAELPAQGFSSEPVHYEYLDHGPIEGYNFYQLQQQDMDGRVWSFPVVSAYVAPHSPKLWMAGKSLHWYSPKVVSKVEVYDMAGRRCEVYHLPLPIAGKFQVELSPNLPTICLIRLVGENSVWSFQQRFIPSL